MGRPSWATAPQRDFLDSYLCQLEKAKATTGLIVLYRSIAEKFLESWAPEPVVTVFPMTSEEYDRTMARHKSVCTFFLVQYDLRSLSQIVCCWMV